MEIPFEPDGPRAFAWPCILQSAGFVSVTGGKVGLSPAGRKVLSSPSHAAIRVAWEKWLKTGVFDEFERVEAIKGKKPRGSPHRSGGGRP